jgi:hypothetical protein
MTNSREEYNSGYSVLSTNSFKVCEEWRECFICPNFEVFPPFKSPMAMMDPVRQFPRVREAETVLPPRGVIRLVI